MLVKLDTQIRNLTCSKLSVQVLCHTTRATTQSSRGLHFLPGSGSVAYKLAECHRKLQFGGQTSWARLMEPKLQQISAGKAPILPAFRSDGTSLRKMMSSTSIGFDFHGRVATIYTSFRLNPLSCDKHQVLCLSNPQRKAQLWVPNLTRKKDSWMVDG